MDKKEEQKNERFNLIESLFITFSPKKALEREICRQNLKELKVAFNYKAAEFDRFRNNWYAPGGSAESINAKSRPILRNRGRYEECNSPLAKAAINALIRNCIGKGIRPQAATENEALNDKLEALFNEWVKPKLCDITGHNSFYELQALVLRRMIVDGEMFVYPVVVKDKKSKIPFKIQTLESDLLDEAIVQAPGSKNAIVSGVEVDNYSAPLGYWFQQISPDGLQIYGAKRVPADEVIHLFNKTRAQQVRGISELAQVLDTIKSTDDYKEAELIAARIAACFALAVEVNGNPGSSGRMQNDAKGNKYEVLSPGQIYYLNPGESVKTANPSRAAAGVKDFMELQQREVAAGMGQSYEVVTRDMSKATYSSARQGQLEDRKTWEPVQEFMNVHFNQPIWELFVTYAVLSGKVTIRDFWNDPEKYYKCEWVTPGWDWVDPLKDVKATNEELSLNLTTLKEKCAERGKDWRQILKQRAKEKELERQFGLIEEEGSEPSARKEGKNK